MGKFVGIAGRIIEHLPFAINLVERFMGKGSGAAKQVAVGREVLEFVAELIRDNPADEWSDVTPIERGTLLNALEDEKEFVSKISDVNDSIVALVNYVNSKAKSE